MAASKESKIIKTPKGTRDFGPAEMAIRDKAMKTIINVFRRHGAVTIDTPIFELKEVLTSKYGEDSKLIFDLQDQGGELCSLRYDLTVPFARYLSQNKGLGSFKRYHIGKVYRRDQPYMTKGRYREFFQCDFDISGSSSVPMLPDAEVMKVIYSILTELKLGEFEVRVNHRALLDGIFESAGVGEHSFRAVCSSVDKLDKMDWQDVKREMMVNRGISEEVADAIGSVVQLKGEGNAFLKDVLSEKLAKNDRISKGLEELLALEYFLSIWKVPVIYDMSLARGLDYYTGVIMEVVLKDSKGSAGIGSIAGGGRYDDLVGMFSKNSSGIPCVGASVGIERILSLLEEKQKGLGEEKSTPVDVYVAAAGADLLPERMQWVQRLWEAGICAEMSQKKKLKTLDQFTHCEKMKIPLCLILGPEELKEGLVKIRVIETREERQVKVEDVMAEINSSLLPYTLGNNL